MASTFDFTDGAKPPSSPTAVLYPRFFSTPLSVWKTSTPQRNASENDGAPTGITMNSWKSTLLSACAPPLRMFIIGTGNTLAAAPPRYRYRGRAQAFADARAAAIETARIAFAPSRPLLGVPSNSMSLASSVRWSAASTPARASAISPLTLATACRTPLPRYCVLSPSRNSTASCSPVDAPLGTMARALAPPSRKTSASTVGLPRESSTWRPRISAILVIGISASFTYLMDLETSSLIVVKQSETQLAASPAEAKLYRTWKNPVSALGSPRRIAHWVIPVPYPLLFLIYTSLKVEAT